PVRQGDGGGRQGCFGLRQELPHAAQGRQLLSVVPGRGQQTGQIGARPGGAQVDPEGAVVLAGKIGCWQIRCWRAGRWRAGCWQIRHWQIRRVQIGCGQGLQVRAGGIVGGDHIRPAYREHSHTGVAGQALQQVRGLTSHGGVVELPRGQWQVLIAHRCTVVDTRRGQRRRLPLALAYRGVVPETTRSPLALAALATAAIPGLDVIAALPPRVPGADFDVAAVLDSERNRWVVRAPRTAAAGAAMEGEIAVLHHLGQAADDGRLGFQVPRPAGFAALPEGGRAMIYPELVGSPLRVDDIGPGPGLAAEVGRALARLHELDTLVVADAGLPTYDADTYRRRRLNELDEAARTGHVPASLLRRW